MVLHHRLDALFIDRPHQVLSNGFKTHLNELNPLNSGNIISFVQSR